MRVWTDAGRSLSRTAPLHEGCGCESGWVPLSQPESPTDVVVRSVEKATRALLLSPSRSCSSGSGCACRSRAAHSSSTPDHVGDSADNADADICRKREGSGQRPFRVGLARAPPPNDRRTVAWDQREHNDHRLAAHRTPHRLVAVPSGGAARARDPRTLTSRPLKHGASPD